MKLPLFPLGTVLFPGLLLPLHVFEPRYRQLVRDLLAGPEPRQFGVIAIRKGRETGADGVSALYQIGCTATVRRVIAHDDGRFDLVTAGAQRFRLGELDHSLPYLQGTVEPLAEETGDQAAAAAAAGAATRAFREYVAVLGRRGRAGAGPDLSDLPDDPVRLSYLVAASVVTGLPQQQALLAEPDAVRRLTAEQALLARETAMLEALSAAPDPGLPHSPYHPN